MKHIYIRVPLPLLVGVCALCNLPGVLDEDPAGLVLLPVHVVDHVPLSLLTQNEL